VEARSDNSPEKNSKSLSNHTGEGVIVDIGTGDGRFVFAAAKAYPNKFFIGIDPNVGPLEKPSMKATRKPDKAGLPNALFIQAAVEDLPAELNGTADEVHVHFPWGSLLKAIALGDIVTLLSIRRIAAPYCNLEVIIGIDPQRDRSEVQRLGIPELTPEFIKLELERRYLNAGLELIEYRILEHSEWSKLETSWARKLTPNEGRKATYLLFEAVSSDHLA
jgi:16S rRNA (adenine(1408)-N(1))-methyltransferase